MGILGKEGFWAFVGQRELTRRWQNFALLPRKLFSPTTRVRRNLWAARRAKCERMEDYGRQRCS